MREVDWSYLLYELGVCSGKFAQPERPFRTAVVVFTADSRAVQL